MAQDLLSAIGSRLEAQLNAQDARLKTIEEAVKARVSLHPPAPFSLLPDGTKQFGYAPRVDSAVDSMPLAGADDAGEATEVAAQTEDLSDAGASFAALVSATAQIFTETAAETKIAPVASASSEPMTVTPANQNPILLSGSAAQVEQSVPMPITIASAPEASVAARVVQTAAAAVDVPVVASAAAAAVTAASSTASTPVANTASATTPVAAKVAANVSAGFVMLADGTKQFGYAPTGATAGVNVPAAKTPPVPTNYGVGATIRRKGVGTDTPITVTRTGDGVIFANFTDSEGTREMAFYPNQMDLVTAAP